MPKAAPALTSFNSGEWSARMEGRVDLDRYGSACRTLENFIPLVQGGVEKRPGFRFVREPPRFQAPLAKTDLFAATATTRTGYGFAPSFIIAYTTQNSTSTTLDPSTNIYSIGFATGPLGVAHSHRVRNSSVAADCARGNSSADIVQAIDNGSATEDGATAVLSINSDGVVYQTTNAYSTVPAISTWNVGGDVIRACEVVTFATPTSTGEYVVQGADPFAEYDFAFLISSSTTSVDSVVSGNACAVIGMCDADAQGVVSCGDEQASDPTNSGSLSTTSSCLTIGTPSGASWTSLVVASRARFDGNSLVLNFTTVSATPRLVSVLLVQSRRALRVKSFTTPASTGVFTAISGLPGRPRGAFYVSSGTPDSTTWSDGLKFSVCGVSDTENAGVQSMASSDNSATSTTANRINTTAMWSNLDSDIPSVLGEISPSSFGATSISLDCNTAQSGKLVLAAVLTDVAESVPPSLVPFSFNELDSYALEFGNGYIAFYRDGLPLLETALAITGATQANPVVLTIAAHGYRIGDEVSISGMQGMLELNGGIYVAGAATTNTVSLFRADGTSVDGTGFGAYTTGGTAARVYKVHDSPYEAGDTPSAWAGQNDVLYLASPNHAPHKLSRFGATDWTLEPVPFDYVAFAPENKDDASYVAASAASGSVTITATDPIFTASHVGSWIKLREIIESSNAKWKEGVEFDNVYLPWSTVSGMVVGERCYHEDKVYELVDRHPGVTDVTGNQPPVHEEGIGFDGRWEWRFVNYGFGYVLITAVTDAHRATATVVVTLPLSCVSPDKSITGTTAANPVQVTSTAHGVETGDKVFIRDVTTADELNNQVYLATRTGANTFTIPVNGTSFGAGTGGVFVVVESGPRANAITRTRDCKRWSWNAWDAARGYPRAVTFYQDRLWWGGTDADPQTMWASVTGDYEDHRTFDADDSALVVSLASSSGLQWILATGALTIGTGAEEFSSNRNATEPLSPANVHTIQVRSRFGSQRDVRPLGVGTAILMVQRSARKLRELVFDDTEDALVGPDMTRLAEHITIGLLAEIVFQGEPNRIAWGRLETGELVAMTYERDEDVIGWHRHPLGGDGLVRSLCAIPHPDGDGDQLWAVVERQLSGSPRIFVEYQEKPWIEGRALADAFFVDAGLSYAGSAATVIRGGQHLAGESVRVVADGIDLGALTVSASGSITLPAAASAVHYGLEYGSVLETMNLEAGAADGTAQGKLQRVTRAVVRLYQMSGDLEYGPTASAFRQRFKSTAGALYDGDTPLLAWPAGSERGSRIALRHSSPLPATVLAIFPALSTQD